jgi:hypothetical protein
MLFIYSNIFVVTYLTRDMRNVTLFCCHLLVVPSSTMDYTHDATLPTNSDESHFCMLVFMELTSDVHLHHHQPRMRHMRCVVFAH